MLYGVGAIGQSGVMERADVLSMYREGVSAVRRAVQGWHPDQWRRPACGTWSGTDVVGHLLCLVSWHHRWLDRAEAGDASPPFGVDELSERNRLALIDLRPESGPERVGLFVEDAERYTDRLDSSWALPLGFPHGTVPAGSHAVVVALEWHLHAWDLSGGAHRPSNPRALLLGTHRALAASRRGLRAWVGGAAGPLVQRRRPWERVLACSGRRLAP